MSKDHPVEAYRCPTCAKVDKVVYHGNSKYYCQRCEKTFEVKSYG